MTNPDRAQLASLGHVQTSPLSPYEYAQRVELRRDAVALLDATGTADPADLRAILRRLSERVDGLGQVKG